MREVGNPFGAQKASALRETEHEAEEKGDRCAEESAPQARRGSPHRLLIDIHRHNFERPGYGRVFLFVYPGNTGHLRSV
jgi:hypothetical protein